MKHLIAFILLLLAGQALSQESRIGVAVAEINSDWIHFVISCKTFDSLSSRIRDQLSGPESDKYLLSVSRTELLNRPDPAVIYHELKVPAELSELGKVKFSSSGWIDFPFAHRPVVIDNRKMWEVWRCLKVHQPSWQIVQTFEKNPLLGEGWNRFASVFVRSGGSDFEIRDEQFNTITTEQASKVGEYLSQVKASDRVRVLLCDKSIFVTGSPIHKIELGGISMGDSSELVEFSEGDSPKQFRLPSSSWFLERVFSSKDGHPLFLVSFREMTEGRHQLAVFDPVQNESRTLVSSMAPLSRLSFGKDSFVCILPTKLTDISEKTADQEKHTYSFVPAEVVFVDSVARVEFQLNPFALFDVDEKGLVPKLNSRLRVNVSKSHSL